MMTHAFVICAYKINPFLEATIKSVLDQKVKSAVYIATSTPNEHISSLAEKYALPLCVNPGETGIGADWNFALSVAGETLVTIAHQDDIYDSGYAEAVIKRAERDRDSLIIFTDYYELRGDEKETDTKNLRIKRLMNDTAALLPRSKWLRSFVLSLGSPICCPAITYNKARIGDFHFRTDYRNSLDWDACCRLARMDGCFSYIARPLMGHRIYEESQTTLTIETGIRAQEDYEIFRRFWPKVIADALSRAYSGAQKSNELGK